MEVCAGTGALTLPVDQSHSISKSESDVAHDSLPTALSPSPSPSRDVDSPAALKSEEYRQMFRLPPEEVLVSDFNCALQESILLQGHMYLFTHYICFYSNIFGFETKKVIPFRDITSVKRAKTAGIFPNAIEIFAGGKKHFFASFLSRDEALKLIEEGWSQHHGGSVITKIEQESVSGSDDQENGLPVEKGDSFRIDDELDSNARHGNALPNVSQSSTDTEGDTVVVTLTQQQEVVDNEEHVFESNSKDPSSSSTRKLAWEEDADADAPEVPNTYTMVAETKFPIKVEEFYNLFFSDDSVKFVEAFHARCGDKEFKCSSWYPKEKYHARDVSFQHPIKIYFGTKCGSCQEVQKFRVYRNSHLVIETSQEITDVPYGDYFCVQGLWDVIRDGEGPDEGCILHVYVNVAFSKKTVFKGKIVQSTIEECREAYALWIEMAHELLKQKNLEKQEGSPAVGSVQNDVFQIEKEVVTADASRRLGSKTDGGKIAPASVSENLNQKAANIERESLRGATEAASSIGGYLKRFSTFLTNQSQVSLILIIAFIVIFLMQVSILVLLSRPRTVTIAPSGGYYGGDMSSGVGGKSPETAAWLERRMHHLKDEMYMVEAQLDRLRQELGWLKTQFKGYDNVRKPK